MTTAVATREDTGPRAVILSTIERYADQIAALAPRGVEPAHYLAALRLHLAQNPKLLDCDPISITQGMLRVAQTGLELGVTCDLLPFKTNCQFNPRYTGFIELALASGVRSINADVVREDDKLFEFQKGTEFYLRHQRGQGKGQITWAYAIAEIKVGSFVFEVITREEIEKLRQRYSKQWKNGELEDISWYARKTAVRKLSALLPKNARFAAALAFDREVEDAIEQVPEGEYEIQSDTAADTPVASAPTAATGHEQPTDQAEAQSDELTLDQAKATKLPGSPDRWNGNGGKPLDLLSTPHLKSIRKWCATRLEEVADDDGGTLQLIVDASNLIILDREKDQTVMQLDEKKPAGANSVKMPPAGKINDTFPVDVPGITPEQVASNIAENERRAAEVGL